MGASLNSGGGSSGRRGRRKKHAPMAEINVTPFVDVMLVLLIIFMVTAPLMATGIPIDLPKTGAKQVEQAKKEPFTISFTQDGKIYLGAEEKIPVPLADLRAKLSAIDRDKSEVIHLRGHRQAEYGFAADLMKAVQDSGFNRFVLRTDPTTGG